MNHDEISVQEIAAYTDLVDILQLKKRGRYYRTQWGNKTDAGMIASIAEIMRKHNVL